MWKWIQAFIDKITAGKIFSENNDEMYLYLTITVAIAFAGLMHVFLLIAISIIGILLFVILNCISILIYSGLLFLVLKYRTYMLAGIVTTAEVILFALFASLYMGGDCYFFLYFFLLLLIQMNVPYAKIRVRVVSSVLIFAALVVSVAVGFSSVPLYADMHQYEVLAILNCIMCFFGILVELLAINIIRRSSTERVRKYEKRAHTDSLTGIYNRWYADAFITNFSTEKEEAQWCVAMLDVDDFKNVNDTMGHSAGDDVLRSLANLLVTNFRKSDVLFRWGGEEFLIFLSDVDAKTAAGVLDTVRKQIAETPVLVAGKKIDYTVTIGVAEVDLKNIQESIMICDERMYYGKQHGKNQVVYSDNK